MTTHAFQADPLVCAKGDLAPLCVCGKRESDAVHASAEEQAVVMARAHVLGEEG